MPYLIYNHGKSKTYLTKKQHGMLIRKYYDSLNLSDSERISRSFTSDSLREARAKSKFIENYILNIANDFERTELTNITFTGKEAQAEVHELLWAFCELHPSFSLAILSSFPHKLVIPSSVDIDLSRTFGNTFFIVHQERVWKGLDSPEKYITFALPITVDNISAIIGDFSSFSILFKNNTKLNFQDIGKKANTSSASITLIPTEPVTKSDPLSE